MRKYAFMKKRMCLANRRDPFWVSHIVLDNCGLKRPWNLEDSSVPKEDLIQGRDSCSLPCQKAHRNLGEYGGGYKELKNPFFSSPQTFLSYKENNSSCIF